MIKVVGLSGAVSGSQTLTTLREVEKEVGRSYGTEVEFTLLDLRTLEVVFSDGRDYHEYEGDTAKLAATLADADAIIIGAPVFQGGDAGGVEERSRPLAGRRPQGQGRQPGDQRRLAALLPGQRVPV